MTAPEGEMMMVDIPSEPTLGVLMSMAMRYDHAFGCPGYYDQFYGAGEHAKRLESTLATMRKLYEEVAHQGFYSEARETHYAALAPQSPPQRFGETKEGTGK